MADNLAVVLVSSDLILDALGFPDGTRLINTRINLDTPNVVDILVSHEDLPELKEGDSAPYLLPEYRLVNADSKPNGKWIEFSWDGSKWVESGDRFSDFK